MQCRVAAAAGAAHMCMLPWRAALRARAWLPCSACAWLLCSAVQPLRRVWRMAAARVLACGLPWHLACVLGAGVCAWVPVRMCVGSACTLDGHTRTGRAGKKLLLARH